MQTVESVEQPRARSGAVDLARLLEPVGLGRFHAEYFGRAPLVISRHDPAFYDHVLTAGDVDDILARDDIFYPTIRVYRNGAVDPRTFTHTYELGGEFHRDMIDNVKVLALYEAGATLMFRGVERYSRAIMALRTEIEAVLGTGTDVSMFVSPCEAHENISAHYDGVDNIVLQIAGRKRWRLWREPYENPLIEQPFGEVGPLAVDDNLIADTILEPGDMLYMPTGVVHQTDTTDTSSLHVTFGLNVPRWYHLFSRMALKIFRDVRHDERYRRALPLPPWVPGAEHDLDGAAYAALVEDLRPRFERSRALAVLDDEHFRGKYPSRPGQLASMAALGTLDARTRLTVVPTVPIRVTETAEHCLVEFHDNVLRLPRAAHALVGALLAGKPIAVGELPGSAAESSKIAIARQLIREGFCVVADRLDGVPDWRHE
jgi:ribosomal protein L16 Arg81 hydroxylase